MQLKKSDVISFLLLFVPEKPFCSPQPQSHLLANTGQIMTLHCSEGKRRKFTTLSRHSRPSVICPEASLPCVSPMTCIRYILGNMPTVFLSLGETGFTWVDRFLPWVSHDGASAFRCIMENYTEEVKKYSSFLNCDHQLLGGI